MKYIILILASSCAPLFAGSMQDSTSKEERQKVNFCGILRSTGNPTEAISAENIGMPSYKRIQVFEKPSNPHDPCVDPHKSTAELNLKDIRMIKQVPAPRDLEPEKTMRRERDHAICNTTYTFKGRKYAEIEVTFNDPLQTKRSFLVEDTRRIVYDEIVDGFLLKRKMNISALDSLEIKGHYEINEDEKEKVPGSRCKMIINGLETEPTLEPKTAISKPHTEQKTTIKIPVTK